MLYDCQSDNSPSWINDIKVNNYRSPYLQQLANIKHIHEVNYKMSWNDNWLFQTNMLRSHFLFKKKNHLSYHIKFSSSYKL